MQFRQLCCALCSLLITVSLQARSAEFMQGEKQDKKSRVRWTLGDYLMQKKRVKLMDYWLATNRSATLFEFYASAGQGQYDRNVDGVLAQEVTYQKATLGAYVSMFGIEASHQMSQKDDFDRSEALVLLRLLGASAQGTHLSVGYGWQSWQNDPLAQDQLDLNFAEAQLSLYLTDFWGFNGGYRHYFEEESKLHTEFSGASYRYGTFLEWGWARLSAEWFVEEWDQVSSGLVTPVTREGLEARLSFYF